MIRGRHWRAKEHIESVRINAGRRGKRESIQEDSLPSTGNVYKDFSYRTLNSWAAERRVIAKAEHIEKGSNPRFAVTSLKSEVRDAKSLYEQESCGRGEMENRIKEQQLHLLADRTSTETDACESTEAMVLVCGLCITQRIKTHGALLNRICKGAMQHNSCETPEGWRTGQG